MIGLVSSTMFLTELILHFGTNVLRRIRVAHRYAAANCRNSAAGFFVPSVRSSASFMDSDLVMPSRRDSAVPLASNG
jgi:hypothetical protein